MTTPLSLLVAILLGCGPQVEAPVPDYRVASASVREGPFTNRLVAATSPYLLDHAHDPVDWRPWGEEAFAEARRRDVPVFLSIGYSACHWCHVMHDESFRDPAIGALLNDGFVAIKVDREERPDVDALYIDALFRLAGTAGWPASLWLTPDGRPFRGGTYFPPEPRLGRPGFAEVLGEVTTSWHTDRAGVERVAADVEAGLRAAATPAPGDFPAEAPWRGKAQLLSRWDPVYGGWGRQKFPHVPALEHLLAYGLAHGDAEALARVQEALAVMDRGGLHDHVGGGFHRYTVDPAWTTPHFEKMVTDNALLLRLYAMAASATDEARLVAVADETAAFLMGEMRLPDGTFATSLDATDPGGEGAYYTWTPDEIAAALPPERVEAFTAAYTLTTRPPLPSGRRVLVRGDVDPDDPALVADRRALASARAARPAPRRDGQRVVGHNALCVSALARSGRLLDRPEWIAAAAATAERLLAARSADGALPRTLEPGAPPGVLDDYAFLVEALLDLYEADADPRWLVEADAVFLALLKRFSDADGGMWTTERAPAPLGVRVQEWPDGQTPSGAGRAVLAWVRLAAYGAPTADPSGLDRAIRSAAGLVDASPGATPSMLLAIDGVSRSGVRVVIAHGGDRAAAIPYARVFGATWRPHAVISVLGSAEADALTAFRTLSDKTAGDGEVLAYVCLDGVCRQPVSDLAAFEATLDAVTRASVGRAESPVTDKR